MDTGVIVLIAVVALLVIAAVWFAGRAGRGRKREQEREKLVDTRRQEAVDTHKDQAQARMRAADAAEQQARIERAKAEQEIAQAELTAQGHRDHELVGDVDGDVEGRNSDEGRFTRDERAAEDAPPAEPRRL